MTLISNILLVGIGMVLVLFGTQKVAFAKKEKPTKAASGQSDKAKKAETPAEPKKEEPKKEEPAKEDASGGPSGGGGW